MQHNRAPAPTPTMYPISDLVRAVESTLLVTTMSGVSVVFVEDDINSAPMMKFVATIYSADPGERIEYCLVFTSVSIADAL